MTNKVQKIREEVVRLKSNLIHGACASQIAMETYCKEEAYNEVLAILDTMQEEPVSIWHDANEEPNNMSHCLVFYGDKSLIGHYLHYEPVLYNKQDKAFVTVAYPHQTGYKVEQKSLDGGCVAEVYKDKRDRISISDITSWCYLNDLHNFTQKEEPASEESESWDKFSHIDDAIEDYCRYDSHIVFFTESLNGEPLEEADDREQVESAFKAGAQWQKRKDKQNFKELAVLASHQDGCLALENIQMRLNELIKED